MLSIRNVTCGYGRLRVLQRISVEIAAGAVGIFGPNGAGKTTLVNAILGIVRVQSGSIEFQGNGIHNRRTHEIVHAGIALVPQERELFPGMTVVENLRVGAQQIAHAREQVAETLEEVFGYFPMLRERTHQYAGTLSGGQQRMLAVGRALMARPRLLILDEPSIGLQPSIVHELFSILGAMKQRVPVLVTEQNVKESLRIVDRGYVVENGSIVIEGTASELAGNPEVERSYLGL